MRREVSRFSAGWQMAENTDKVRVRNVMSRSKPRYWSGVCFRLTFLQQPFLL